MIHLTHTITSCTESRVARLLAVALAMPVLVSLSCRRAETATAARPEAAPAASSAAAPSVVSTPHGVASATGGDPSSPTIETAQASFDLPARWRREPPASGARLAQAVIPGDAGPGELAVFHFGADRGGSVESNFERWKGQMRSPAGASPATGIVESAAAGAAGPAFRASWIDVSGTLMPTGMGGPTEEQPNFRLLGAVVEGPGGPWFFKATGPESTLAAAREEFLGILRSARPAGSEPAAQRE